MTCKWRGWLFWHLNNALVVLWLFVSILVFTRSLSLDVSTLDGIYLKQFFSNPGDKSSKVYFKWALMPKPLNSSIHVESKPDPLSVLVATHALFGEKSMRVLLLLSMTLWRSHSAGDHLPPVRRLRSHFQLLATGDVVCNAGVWVRWCPSRSCFIVSRTRRMPVWLTPQTTEKELTGFLDFEL